MASTKMRIYFLIFLPFVKESGFALRMAFLPPGRDKGMPDIAGKQFIMAKTQAKSGWLRASVTVDAPPVLVWEHWTKPEHIVRWNSPSAEWVTRHAINDCRSGGRFVFEMALTDGSLHFDYAGEYLSVIPMESIAHVLDDGRNTIIRFIEDSGVTIIEDFEPDPTQDTDMQQQFCRSVLNNFKNYTEEIAATSRQ